MTLRAFCPTERKGFRVLRRLVLATLFLSVTSPTLASAQEDAVFDFFGSFMATDGATRMFGAIGVVQRSPTFERERRGFGVEVKQVFAPWIGMTLLMQRLGSAQRGAGDEADVDLGIELFPVRVGPIALSLKAFGGMHNFIPDESEPVLLQYGAGGGAYVALTNHVVLGFTATRNHLDTVGKRNAFVLHFLAK